MQIELFRIEYTRLPVESLRHSLADPDVGGIVLFSDKRRSFIFKGQTESIHLVPHLLTHHPAKIQNINFSGAKPSGWPIIQVSQQYMWDFFKYIFLSFFSSPRTLAECLPVKYVIHYCRGQTRSVSLHPTDIFQPDSRCMNKPGISQDSKQMAKPHSVSTFPPATWETHYGQMKHENSRHLQTLFILLFCKQSFGFDSFPSKF